jgi:hypothetical protein
MRGRGMTMRSMMNGPVSVQGSAPQRHGSAHEDELGSELRARQRVGGHRGCGDAGLARSVVAKGARHQKCRAERGKGASGRRPYQSHAVMVRLTGIRGHRVRREWVREEATRAILPADG